MELNYDRLQRHQVRMVRMPSDGVDPSQLHGPCRVYRLGRPISLMEWKQMPADLQKLYLERLRQRGGTDDAVAAMLGTTEEEVRLLLKQYRVVLDRPDPTVWSDFVESGKEA